MPTRGWGNGPPSDPSLRFKYEVNLCSRHGFRRRCRLGRCTSQRLRIDLPFVPSMEGRREKRAHVVQDPVEVDVGSAKTRKTGMGMETRPERRRREHGCKTSWTTEGKDRRRRSGFQTITGGWNNVHVEGEKVDRRRTDNAANHCTNSRLGRPTH